MSRIQIVAAGRSSAEVRVVASGAVVKSVQVLEVEAQYRTRRDDKEGRVEGCQDDEDGDLGG